jgi:hypothetical protein
MLDRASYGSRFDVLFSIGVDPSSEVGEETHRPTCTISPKKLSHQGARRLAYLILERGNTDRVPTLISYPKAGHLLQFSFVVEFPSCFRDSSILQRSILFFLGPGSILIGNHHETRSSWWKVVGGTANCSPRVANCGTSLPPTPPTVSMLRPSSLFHHPKMRLVFVRNTGQERSVCSWTAPTRPA